MKIKVEYTVDDNIEMELEFKYPRICKKWVEMLRQRPEVKIKSISIVDTTSEPQIATTTTPSEIATFLERK